MSTSTQENLINNLELYILNIPALLELRKEVSTLSAKTETAAEQWAREISAEDWVAITDTARQEAESVLEDYDFGYAIEEALRWGNVDLSNALDYDEIVSNSSEFGELQSQVEDIKENVDELTSALDDLSDKGPGANLDTILEQIESRLTEIEDRLNNASINI